MRTVKLSLVKLSSSMIICAGMILAGVGAGLLYREWSRPPAPLFQAQEGAIDLGDVWTQQDIHQSIPLHNRGQAPLELEITKISCGCTSAYLSSPVIEPSGRGSIDLVLKASDKEGPFQVAVGLKTNDPATPEILLQIRGTAREIVSIQPRSLQFGSVEKDELPRSRALEIELSEFGPRDILNRARFESSAPYITFKQKVEDDKLTLDVQLAENIPIGVLREDLIIRFEDVQRYSMKVPIMVRVLGRYTPQPDTFYFGHTQPETPISRSVVIPNVRSSDRVTASVRNPDLQKRSMIDIVHGKAGCKVELFLTVPAEIGTFRSVVDVMIQSSDGQSSQAVQIPLVLSLARSDE